MEELGNTEAFHVVLISKAGSGHGGNLQFVIYGGQEEPLVKVQSQLRWRLKHNGDIKTVLYVKKSKRCRGSRAALILGDRGCVLQRTK